MLPVKDTGSLLNGVSADRGVESHVVVNSHGKLATAAILGLQPLMNGDVMQPVRCALRVSCVHGVIDNFQRSLALRMSQTKKIPYRRLMLVLTCTSN